MAHIHNLNFLTYQPGESHIIFSSQSHIIFDLHKSGNVMSKKVLYRILWSGVCFQHFLGQRLKHNHKCKMLSSTLFNLQRAW